MDAGQWNVNPRVPPGLTGLELVQSHNSFISLSLSALLSISLWKCYYEKKKQPTSSAWPGLAQLGLGFFFICCQSSTTLLSPIHHLAWELHLAGSPPLNFMGVYPSVCVTPTWKTRSNPQGASDAWSILITRTKQLQCYDVVGDQTPGSFSSAFEQNTLSFLICSDGNGHWLGWCNAKWSW